MIHRFTAQTNKFIMPVSIIRPEGFKMEKMPELLSVLAETAEEKVKKTKAVAKEK